MKLKYNTDIQLLKAFFVKNYEIQVPLDVKDVKEYLSEKLQVSINDIRINKRSIDARRRPPVFHYSVDIFESIQEKLIIDDDIFTYPKLSSNSKRVIVVGSGPAGYFSALRLLNYGIRPIIVERGKDVQNRRKDLRQIQQFSQVNPDSNYCFGEGGAGTYSDGKLYTRSGKRRDIQRILRILHHFGADESILIDAHPHIGSNRLPMIIKAMRERLLSLGAEIYFQSRMTDMRVENSKAVAVELNHKDLLPADAVILATGHSARDIFYLFKKHGWAIIGKPFALGLRVEHPQSFIDKLRYGTMQRNPILPAAEYRVQSQVNGKGIYSFCMCPGGFIVPASTGPNELVINGMSLSRRDSYFANSGIVTSIEDDDLDIYYHRQGELRFLEFQSDLEKLTFNLVANQSQQAPAQRLEDFLQGKISPTLHKSSYIPGLTSRPLHDLFPKPIYHRLRTAFYDFNKKMKGFIQDEAQVLAIESRTSSPIRIPRDSISREHIQIANLYPCGEGAGYAGGILSAAMDGEKTADIIAEKWVKK